MPRGRLTKASCRRTNRQDFVVLISPVHDWKVKSVFVHLDVVQTVSAFHSRASTIAFRLRSPINRNLSTERNESTSHISQQGWNEQRQKPYDSIGELRFVQSPWYFASCRIKISRVAMRVLEVRSLPFGWKMEKLFRKVWCMLHWLPIRKRQSAAVHLLPRQHIHHSIWALKRMFQHPSENHP